MKKVLKTTILTIVMVLTMCVVAFAEDITSKCSTIIGAGYKITITNSSVTIGSETFDCSSVKDVDEGYTAPYKIKPSSGSAVTMYFTDDDGIEFKQVVEELVADIKEKDVKRDSSIGKVIEDSKNDIRDMASALGEINPTLREGSEIVGTDLTMTIVRKLLSAGIFIFWIVMMIQVLPDLGVLNSSIIRGFLVGESVTKGGDDEQKWKAVIVSDECIRAIKKAEESNGGQRAMTIYLKEEIIKLILAFIATSLFLGNYFFHFVDKITGVVNFG